MIVFAMCFNARYDSNSKQSALVLSNRTRKGGDNLITITIDRAKAKAVYIYILCWQCFRIINMMAPMGYIIHRIAYRKRHIVKVPVKCHVQPEIYGSSIANVVIYPMRLFFCCCCFCTSKSYESAFSMQI